MTPSPAPGCGPGAPSVLRASRLAALIPRGLRSREGGACPVPSRAPSAAPSRPGRPHRLRALWARRWRSSSQDSCPTPTYHPPARGARPRAASASPRALYGTHSNRAVTFRRAGGGKVVPRRPLPGAEFAAGRQALPTTPSAGRAGPGRAGTRSAAPVRAGEAPLVGCAPLRRSLRRGIAGRRDRGALTRTARRYAST